MQDQKYEWKSWVQNSNWSRKNCRIADTLDPSPIYTMAQKNQERTQEMDNKQKIAPKTFKGNRYSRVKTTQKTGQNKSREIEIQAL